MGIDKKKFRMIGLALLFAGIGLFLTTGFFLQHYFNEFFNTILLFSALILVGSGIVAILIGYSTEVTSRYVHSPAIQPKLSENDLVDYKTCPKCGSSNKGDFCIECGEKFN